MRRHLRASVGLMVVSLVVCGGIYPLLTYGVGQSLFPREANGSFVPQEGRGGGTALIGQDMTDGAYFWSRPSATPDHPYNAAYSAARNLSPHDPQFFADRTERERSWRAAHPYFPAMKSVPADAVTASASGLDPDISVENARAQTLRIATARGIADADVTLLLESLIETPYGGIIGQEKVNVLKLNRALDGMKTLP